MIASEKGSYCILKPVDSLVYTGLKQYEELGEDYWDFKHNHNKKHSHGYFNYPAMMVPAMQAELISAITKNQKNISKVVDPYVGSGTVMTECMFRGLDFYGQDINPLALLICKAKKGPFYINAIRKKVGKLLEHIKKDNSNNIDVNFKGIDKWFRRDVSIDLSKIRRAIMKEPSLWARRFFWVALAEIIRLCSNSRTSTFKLHIRPKEEIERRELDAIKKFAQKLKDNLDNMILQRNDLKEHNLLSKESYSGNVKVSLKDSSKKIGYKEKYDLLISSPPYGDNHTTVTYGQFSYLPLQWIPLSDIEKNLGQEWLRTLSEIDRRSLGGSTSKEIEEEKYNSLINKSPSLKGVLEFLDINAKDKKTKVINFFSDLGKSLALCVSVLKKDAYMIWTVGNRTVAGIQIPLDDIIVELLEAKGGKLVARLHRSILNKRMACKNDTVNTMAKEIILVIRNKAGGNISGK